MMAPKKYISPDLDPLFESITELFNENQNKGFASRKKFRFLRIVLINFLAACSELGVSKAKAMHSITFHDGSYPQTVIARPPAWLKIDTKARNRLEHCGSPEKFIDTLRKIVAAQTVPLEGPKRQTASNTSRARKRRQKSIANQPQPASSAFAHQSVPNQLINAEAVETKKHNEPMLPTSGPSGGSETQVDPLLCHDKSIQKEQEGVLQATSTPSLGFPSPVQPNVSSEAVIVSTIEPRQEDANTLSMLDTCPRAESLEENHEQLLPTPPQDDTWPKDAEPREDARVGEESLSPELVSQAMDLDDDEPSCEVDKDGPPPPNPFINVLDLAAEILDISASSWEEYRPKLIEHILELGLGHTTPCASLQPEIAGTLLQRTEFVLARLDSEISKIPSTTWECYKTQLLALSKSAKIQTMSFVQRLWEIGRIIYVSEEEAVMVSRDWGRLRNAALLCALLAESMGKESEVCEDRTKKWLESKLRDIKWLEKVLDTQTKVGNILASSSST